MNNKEKIELWLNSYADSLEYFEGGGSLDQSGRYKPGHPVIEEKTLAYLLEKQETTAIAEYEREYAQLNERFNKLRQKLGDQYEHALRDELDNYLIKHPKVVCFAFDSGKMEIELENDLAIRDHLEHLLDEVGKREDLHDERIRVAAIDDVLRCKFKLNTDLLREYRDLLEESYLPETFWWRHLDSFLD